MKLSKRNSGHTIGSTMIILVLAMLIWNGVLLQMAGYLRVEKACTIQNWNLNGTSRALVWSLSLLETGIPPTDPYSCRMDIANDVNDIYVATFNKTANLSYTISIRLATDEDMSLPQAPDKFKAKKPKDPKDPKNPKKAQESERTKEAKGAKNSSRPGKTDEQQ